MHLICLHLPLTSCQATTTYYFVHSTLKQKYELSLKTEGKSQLSNASRIWSQGHIQNGHCQLRLPEPFSFVSQKIMIKWLLLLFILTTITIFFRTNLNLFLDSQKMCSIIDGFPTGVDKLTKVFSAASLYYNYSGTHSCFDIENDSDPHGLNGWGWQVNSWSPFPYILMTS